MPPITTRLVIAVSLAALLATAAPAKNKAASDSPLTPDYQTQLDKASRYMRKSPEKAIPLVQDALNAANDIPKVLAVASYTEQYGAPMVETRRACIKKALSLCNTREDYFQVALKARQYECFEDTRAAVNHLVDSSNSLPELYDLAHKSQEVALNDIARLAMDKAYGQCETVEDALRFARQAKLLGMEDLVRKTCKDLINDEHETRSLCILLRNLEPFDYKDLNRYLLKKALDVAKTVQDFNDVCDAAKRHQHEDIFKLSQFRGKKLVILNRYKEESAAYNQKLEEFRKQGAQQQSQPAPNPSGF